MGSFISNRKFLSNLMCLVILILFSNSGFAQPEFDKMFLNCWRIENPRLIDSLLTEFMLPKEGARVVEIIDINDNGPDDSDVLRITPEGSSEEGNNGHNASNGSKGGSYQVYALSEIGLPESVKKRINSWDLGSKMPQGMTFQNLDDARRWYEKKKTAKSSIVVTALTGLLQNYQGNDFKLMLERHPNGSFVFNIIGFDEAKSEATAPWDPNKEMSGSLIQEMKGAEVMRAFFESLKNQYRNELVVMHVSRRDTVMVTPRSR